MNAFLSLLDPLLVPLFRLHDGLSTVVVRYMRFLKMSLLIIAHLTLLGFLVPELRKNFGEMAANLLIVILFLGPLSVIFRMRLLLLVMGFRRELGILMGYLATVHGVGYFLDPTWFDFVIRPYWPGALLGIEPTILFGILAYILTLPLLFSSNTWANRTLGGKNWKRLHRLVYIVFIFAVVHRALMRGGDLNSIFQATILLSAYGLLKLLAWKNFLSPLRELILRVSERYQQWKVSQKEVISTASV